MIPLIWANDFCRVIGVEPIVPKPIVDFAPFKLLKTTNDYGIRSAVDPAVSFFNAAHALTSTTGTISKKADESFSDQLLSNFNDISEKTAVITNKLSDIGIGTLTENVENRYYPEIKEYFLIIESNNAKTQELLNEALPLECLRDSRNNLYKEYFQKYNTIHTLELKMRRANKKIDLQKKLFKKIDTKRTWQGVTTTPDFLELQKKLKILNYTSLSANLILGTAPFVFNLTAWSTLISRANVFLVIVDAGLQVELAISAADEKLRDFKEKAHGSAVLIRELTVVIKDLKNDTDKINESIKEILGSCFPPQTEDTFVKWAEVNIEDLSKNISWKMKSFSKINLIIFQELIKNEESKEKIYSTMRKLDPNFEYEQYLLRLKS